MSNIYRFFLGAVLLVSFGCSPDRSAPSGALNVVTTTSMIGDLAREIGGEHVEVTSLMGPGIDPHLYKASEGDVSRMVQAELVLYNGLHLEGKMVDIFEQMESRGANVHAVADAVPQELQLSSEFFVGSFDPHIWFDAGLWKLAAGRVAEILADSDSSNAAFFQQRAVEYGRALDSLDAWTRQELDRVPEGVRALVTSHDAFGYFGRAYDFEVRGLQGLSTATEAGTADVQDLAAFVAANRIPSMFVESSISPRGIEAVREAVRDQGFEVRIGGTLYGDALGAPGSAAGTYVGMVRENVRTIVEGLAPVGEAAVPAPGTSAGTDSVSTDPS